MSASNQELNLDELGFLGRGKSKHRPRNDKVLYGGDYPFIQTGDVKAANLHIREYRDTYNETGLAQSKLWDKGTLLITIAANIAETAVLDIKACFPDSIVGFVPDETKVNSYFIKYYIDHIKREMQSISQGTTQDNLSLDKIRTFKLKIPEKKIVDEITNVLLSYDNLIDNNNRRIAILEEMAQSLYREWFVKFRFPGHENTKFIDSPLGKIPEGWGIKKHKDVCHLTMGQSPKSEFYNEKEDGLPFFQGVKDFGQRFPTVRIWCSKPTRLAEAGDVLFSVRAPVGRLNLADQRIAIGRGLCAIRDTKGNQSFLFQQLKSIFTSEDMIGNGAIFASVTKKDMEDIKLISPEDRHVAEFCRNVDPIFDLLDKLSKKNEVLKSQRDLLLPKLISGAIKLQD